VEHYIAEINGIPVIQSVVLNSGDLNAVLNSYQRKAVYDAVYAKSVKHFAVDVNDNKKQMQHNLGISGVGMIVYMNDGALAGDIDVEGAVVKADESRGVFELSEAERKRYAAEEKGIAGQMAVLFGKIAAEKERGRTWQKPGYGYGLTMNTDRSRALGSEYTASRFVGTEKGRNVETIRVASSNIGDILAALSKEKSGAKRTDVEKIRNLLNSDKDLAKVADLPKLSELITANGELKAEAVTLIQRAFENGFTGIHTDASGIQDTAVLNRALGEIDSITRKTGVQMRNYVSFNSTETATVLKSETINSLAKAHNFTPVIKIGARGESVTPERVKQTLGNIENAAVEIQGIITGEELTAVQGQIVLAWLHNTSGISKDKSRAKSASKKMGAAYKGALTSDYITDMKVAEIAGLRTVMSEQASEDGAVRAGQFASMLNALEKAGVSANSVLYNYAADMQKDGSVESYESARGYLRGAVEKFLETQYVKALDVTADIYNKKVNINDRNAARGLLLYMAVNGESLDGRLINELLKNQRELLNSESGTLTELRTAANVLINEILENPLAADISANKDKVADVKKAFTVLTDSFASSFGLEKAVEGARKGTMLSVGTMRVILTQA
jgi:hypothetical protein